MATRVLFFGRLRDIAGAGERLVEARASLRSIEDLIEFLAPEDDDLRRALLHPSVKIAVDQRVVARASSIDGAREIAFLPPFSGG